MNKWIAVIAAAATAAVVLPAQARNVKYMVPIAAALESPSAAGKLDSSVKLYFGTQAHPATLSKVGIADATGKERIEYKADLPSCQASFVEALRALQKNAKDSGANAVINIVSYFKNGTPVSSTTEFECHAGSFSTILMLKGELVKIADH
ncbi:excinuclease ATPase subunit [Noviherbaspirillum saxi]|uniref:Excinuclease ATPase subunit n=1 Tax=Noviherbaspirillum saxi TaxID=2320863 RepID=A0A3A3FSP8_9BURK|nr:excinuclease ATPase subunit [Noviherbaspirillum saxi]RJF97221.1 excinuclease ATPase subunit [Noviherbaspirillum saxi]